MQSVSSVSWQTLAAQRRYSAGKKQLEDGCSVEVTPRRPSGV